MSEQQKNSMELANRAIELANKKGWSRPLWILAKLSNAERDRIRQTLDFNWSTDTLAATAHECRQSLEAWEIIDCNIRGIAGRLHNIKEQLQPRKMITWRAALIRILEMANVSYSAAASEEDLVQAVVRAVEQRRLLNRGQPELPTQAAFKIGKTVGLAASILKDISVIWDDVLGSQDEPAVAAVYAICKNTHLLS